MQNKIQSKKVYKAGERAFLGVFPVLIYKTQTKKGSSAMGYETFKKELLEVLQEMTGDKTRVSMGKVEKNNGVMLDGLMIHQENSNMAPMFYPAEFYEKWEEGDSMENLAEEILESAEEQRNAVKFSLKDFEDYKVARKNIYYKLINYKMNEKRLEKMPHIKYLDLAVVFYYRVEGGSFHGATVLIREQNLENWGISKRRLLEDAVINSSKKMPYTLQGMEALIAELTGNESEPFKDDELMYVLTNKEKYFGAAVILYPHALNRIAGLLKNNFYILPSSVHECILVPDLGQYSRTELKRMVKEVNENQVEEEEILSYEVYYYNREKEALMM